MKILLIIGLVFGLIVNPANHRSDSKWCDENATDKQNAKALNVSLIARKRRYKPTDHFNLDVVIANTGTHDVYILSELNWGPAASLVIHVRDASGREVQPQGFFDDHTFVSPDDLSAFVKLLPHHFL